MEAAHRTIMAKGCGCLKERLRKRRRSEYDDYNDAELYQ